MSEKFLIKPYIDHYIQAQIIQELADSDSPIRFSNLKEQGMDNSLFMYHANKLLDRGMLEKVNDGFQITTKGARWANNADSNLMSQRLLPRPLIQFIIIKDNKILLGKRVGAMKNHLNEYLLPGALHIYGKTAEQSAKSIIGDIIKNENVDINFLSFAEYIIEFPDFTHHSTAQIYKVNVDTPEVNDSSGYNCEWFEIDKINDKNPSFSNNNLLVKIIQKLPSLSLREVFRMEQLSD